MGDGSDCLDIDDNPAGVGEALDEDCLCLGGDRRPEIGGIIGVNEGAVPAQPFE